MLSLNEVIGGDREAYLFLQCSPFGGVDLLDPEACEFIFYSALLVVESILWTPRHEFICFPSGGCSLSGRVVVFDSEADLFFAVLSFWWSRSFGPRGTNLFFTVDHSLTSRLWAFCEFAADTLKKFLCVHKSCHSPVEKFPASKFIEVCSGIHFQVGQNGPHLASEILHLPCFGWKS